ncbi:MAG TPA: hypothetical protein PKB04_01725 [Phenylobacterium sp.]|jgi:predicted small lipoprotein YifL|uniref:hypothetical protein n=1 Tax=Phenylobacterium sp. TaxID=1871053 RepID=UPI002B55B164|nr:hypothetical protein [Phenylobacterium sp.]HMP61820.1 hypothetical protein [Phenylobacterium sp.]
MTARLPLILALAALSLTACGRAGGLERPPPLWGDPATGEVVVPRSSPSRPVDTVDPRTRSTNPAPSRTLPIDGTSPSPTSSGPQGALPDPYANPR